VAKREAEQLLLEARRDEKKRREIVRQLGLSQKHFTEKQSAFLPQPELLPFNTLQEGDIVFVRSLGYDAKIVNINYKHERVRVQAGTVEIEVAASDLEKKKGRQANSSRPSGYIRAAVNDQVPLQLNIIGKRSDDALQELEPFLNRAALQDVSSVTIIHGIGTGALAKAIHEYLTCHPLVKHFRRGEPQEGGAGVTVVTLM
jgi:DNA mismatch repair protein MutS2